ncbi:zinc finger HIT domain-containing protein 2 [Diretmus argenteus]
MNPLLRQRLPPSVRSLLTDMGPKEVAHCSDWTDPESESETVTRDGIVLPPRGAGAKQEFLTPASTGTEGVTEDGSKQSTVCGVCRSKPSCYTCPRCNLPYCGLACYQSPDHSVCSEEFYKESVLRELKNMGQSEAEGREKMQDILLGLRQKAERTEGGIESVLREVGVVSDEEEEGEGEAQERAQVLDLLSKLAELQQSGEGSTAEIEAILRKLKEVGGQDGDGDFLDEEAEHREEELDMADRLSGLDIDTLSEEALWELLNSQEKEKFMGLIKGGAFGGLVPLWRPWWEVHEEGGRALVEVLQEEVSKPEGDGLLAGGEHNPVRTGGVAVRAEMLPDEQEDGNSKFKKSPETAESQGKSATKVRRKKQESGKEMCNIKGESSALSTVPPISVRIPKLSSLSARPSPLVCYGLVNALFGYTFTLGLFNGDTDSLNLEFCDMILAVAEALNSSRVFNSIQEALDCGEAAIMTGGYFDREDPHASARAVEAVAHIMTGRSRQDPTGYCLAALSQLRSALSQARAAMPKGGGEEGKKRQTIFLAGKKCEFFQAWVSDSADQIRRLAIELWSEHSKRGSERNTMEKAKTVVEESWKKGKRKGNNVLIEELS